MLGGPNVATPDTFTSSSSEQSSDRAMADASPSLILRMPCSARPTACTGNPAFSATSPEYDRLRPRGAD